LSARGARRFVGFYLPALCNAGLVAWLVWHVSIAHDRNLSFQAFVSFYVVGGLAIVLSCGSAFLLLAADQPLATESRDKRLWFTVALVNIILPSVSMFGLVLFR
jgi:hypothetical protein